MEDTADLPERTCIVTREQKDEAALIRFVLSPAGVVTPDLRRKLPGRGCWVAKSRATVAEAVKRQAFGRALKTKVETAADLPEQVASIMRKDLVQSLSMARKAGLAIAGNTKVAEAAAKNLAALIHASEAAADGKAKLNRLCAPDMPVIEFLKTNELELAFGRENVVHAALLTGGLSSKWLELARGFARYENFLVKGLN